MPERLLRHVSRDGRARCTTECRDGSTSHAIGIGVVRRQVVDRREVIRERLRGIVIGLRLEPAGRGEMQ
jgi:hypothetical protein